MSFQCSCDNKQLSKPQSLHADLLVKFLLYSVSVKWRLVLINELSMLSCRVLSLQMILFQAKQSLFPLSFLIHLL